MGFYVLLRFHWKPTIKKVHRCAVLRRGWVSQPIERCDLAPTKSWVHIYRKVVVTMRVTRTLLTLFVLFALTACAQEGTQPNLPAGAIARLGKGLINEVQYSPDGTQLAVASFTGVRLYHTETHREIAQIARHRNVMTSIAFSPDGRLLASTNWDRIVQGYDTVTGLRNQLFIEPRGHVNSVAFSPDGRTLAYANMVGNISLRDTETWEVKRRFNGHWASDLKFSPDGKILAGACMAEVRRWDTETWERKPAFTTEHRGRISRLAFSPDGATLAGGCDDSTVRLWDAATGEQKWTLTGHTKNIANVAFSPDGRTLASGSWDGTVRLWDTVTGEHKRTFTGHTDRVYGVAFSPDGGVLASGSADGDSAAVENNRLNRPTSAS